MKEIQKNILPHFTLKQLPDLFIIFSTWKPSVFDQTLKIHTLHQWVPATQQHAFWGNRWSLNPKKAATCSYEPNGDQQVGHERSHPNDKAETVSLLQGLPEETECCTGYGNSFQQTHCTNPTFFTCTTNNSVPSFPKVFLTTIWTYMQTNTQPNNQANEANPSFKKTNQNETSQHHGESDVRVFLEHVLSLVFGQRNDAFHMWVPYMPVGTELHIAPNRTFKCV